MSTASASEKSLSTVPPQLQSLRDLIKKSSDSIRAVAPKHLDAERLARLVTTECQKNPKLLECAPVTIVGATLQASALGLEIGDGTGRAYLVPFFNSKKNRSEATLIIGYRGLITLMHNTGIVKGVHADVVCAKDSFDYSLGTDPYVKHKLSNDPDRGKVTHAWMAVDFVNGGRQIVVVTVHEIERHRARSKQANSGPWKEDYVAMCLKTVVRIGAKLVPASTDKAIAFHQAVNLENRAAAGQPQDLGSFLDPENEKPTPTDAIEGQVIPEKKPDASAAEEARKNIATAQGKPPADMEGDGQEPIEDPLEDEPKAKQAKDPEPTPQEKKKPRKF